MRKITNYLAVVTFILMMMFSASSAVSAQNIPQLSRGIIRLIKQKEPKWKYILSKEKRGARNTSENFVWKFKSERIEATIVELESKEKALEDIKKYAADKKSISNLGDENYVEWGDPDYWSSIDFRRARVRVSLQASSTDIARKFAQYLDSQIQATVFTDKWPPEETAVIEFQIKDFFNPRTITTPVDIFRGSGGGNGYGCEGCKEIGTDGYGISVYRITEKKVFISLLISKETTTLNESGKWVLTKSMKWEKKFSISSRGTTVKDLGDDVKIKAHIEKR